MEKVKTGLRVSYRNSCKKSLLLFRTLTWISQLLLCFGCARSPISDVSQAMRLLERAPENMADDMGGQSLLRDIKDHIAFFKVGLDRDESLPFGPVRVSKQAYLQALEEFLKRARSLTSDTDIMQHIKEEFTFYEVYGEEAWGDVLVTGYYEPLIKGASQPTAEYTTPLYSCPKDLVSIPLKPFTEVLPNLSELRDRILEQRSGSALLRGRMFQPAGSPVPVIVPYYNREQIDGEKVLAKKNLEIVWVDPIKAFFLQIQGSGIIELPNHKKLRLGYAAQNGYPYVPIGRFLTHRIPLEKMSMQAIEAELRAMEPGLRNEILYQNPSYVFFQRLSGRGQTYSGIEVMAGRTIATDTRYFPKGALAFLTWQKPKFDSPNTTEPTGWETVTRFVLDQDSGGAIRGPHRVDLYLGEGEAAERTAGVMKQRGRLIYLLPKSVHPL